MQPTRARLYRDGPGRFLLAWFDDVLREQFPQVGERLAGDRPGRGCLTVAHAGSIARSPHGRAPWHGPPRGREPVAGQEAAASFPGSRGLVVLAPPGPGPAVRAAFAAC
jgi:hypothetical protein